MAPRIIVVVGPTAVGKTALAMSLYDALGGAKTAHLISVDSALIYRGMDIGTAKPSAAELAQYPHALIDIRNPNETYSVADFIRDADEEVQQALAQDRHAILVGGTMLYAKRFMEGIAELPQADEALRATLQNEYETRGGEALYAELKAIDATAAQEIHPNNPQRLLRALEVIRMTGQPMSQLWRHGEGVEARLGQLPLLYGLFPNDRQQLHENIGRRFDAMLEAGFLDEVGMLRKDERLTLDMPSMRAVGYRQAWLHLDGEIEFDQFIADAKTATRRLAKRQMTWMRQWSTLRKIAFIDPEPIVAQMVKDIW